jgi:septal ring-binding cell division protein DamX
MDEQPDELASRWDVPAPILPAQPASPRGAPRILVGVVAALCVAILAFILWPADQPPPSTPPPPPALPAQEIPRARTLVESFLALRDFSPDAISGFQDEWSGLDEAERREARETVWFASLVRTLGDEITAQKALADLGTGDAALERARRLLALGQELGVADQLPQLDSDAPAAAATGDQAQESPGQSPAPLSPPLPGQPQVSESATGAAAPATASETAGETGEALTGRKWLSARSDDEITLQLFAVNGLDAVEKLMAAHPELSVHILEASGASPRYRVFHGVYADADEARAAYEALPTTVSGASGGAIVKSFAAVREDLYGTSSPQPAAMQPEPSGPRAPPQQSPTPKAPTPAAAGDGGAYTLQLFASGNRANAEALMKAYPALSLQLRESDDARAPYRVIYGNFESAEAARAATGALPPTLVSRIGKPLPRPIADTGLPVSP